MGNNNIPQPFDLLRWFSIASLVALLPVAGLTGFALSHFLTEETLQRDATLTAQFIQNCVEVEGKHAGLGDQVTIAEFLDPRVNREPPNGVSADRIASARREVLDHLRFLPEALLASIYAPDGRVIWSTNPELVGTVLEDDDELEAAFRDKVQLARHHTSNKSERVEQKFVVQPDEFFIENYIPLRDAKGEVVMVAEVYKEPKSLLATIKRGQFLVWGSTVAAGALVYLALFGIIRRGSSLLEQQQKQLVEMDSLAYLGEMASAIAHSLRNPLASIRSSAELALLADPGLVQKNAKDIITQVDFLSRWVREMLLSTRPLTGEPEAVNVVAVLADVVDSFANAFAKAGVTLNWRRDEASALCVEGNVSLVTQVLHSVLANALEGMPQGGELHIKLDVQADCRRCQLIIRDTGIGMSEKQLALAFKPFHTNKRHGLGVGLAMVKRVMERFGGAVRLDSQENEGTEVRLEFKMA